MIDNETNKLLRSSPDQAMAALLTRDLVRMRPAALRHEYLSSIANAINHAEVKTRDEDGNTYFIGFGDRERTVPLVAIQGQDERFFHCMVPRYGHPLERRLIDRLQQLDDVWADEHDTQRRPLAGQLKQAYQSKDLDRISQHGVNAYYPPPRLNPKEVEQLGKHWYDTKNFDPDEAGFEHEWKVDLSEAEDRYTVEKNVSVSASMNSGGPRVRVKLNDNAAANNHMRLGSAKDTSPRRAPTTMGQVIQNAERAKTSTPRPRDPSLGWSQPTGPEELGPEF